MHDIEPYYRWRDHYVAAEDSRSPFYGRVYDEFTFTKKIYNYFIHPQWDEFGSSTLYLKVIYADYEEGYAIIEFIGEWNDTLYDDIMFLKRAVIDQFTLNGIHKFILICENVLNFHGSDDCYYEEWWDDVKEEDGWICFLNTLEHVQDEMQQTRLQNYVNFGRHFNGVNWRPHKAKVVYQMVEHLLHNQVRQLTY
ncbi:MAG: hypothetical protein AAF798_20305 [Bacteroidota bacterium]